MSYARFRLRESCIAGPSQSAPASRPFDIPRIQRNVFRQGKRGSCGAGRSQSAACAVRPFFDIPRIRRNAFSPGEAGFVRGGALLERGLRSESKKRGTSARSAPVPRVFEAFGTRTSGRRRSLPPFSRPPHASSTPPTPQAPLSAPQNTPAPHPPVPASPCPRPPRAEARWGAWSSRPTRIPGNLPRQGHLR